MFVPTPCWIRCCHYWWPHLHYYSGIAILKHPSHWQAAHRSVSCCDDRESTFSWCCGRHDEIKSLINPPSLTDRSSKIFFGTSNLLSSWDSLRYGIWSSTWPSLWFFSIAIMEGESCEILVRWPYMVALVKGIDPRPREIVNGGENNVANEVRVEIFWKLYLVKSFHDESFPVFEHDPSSL